MYSNKHCHTNIACACLGVCAMCVCEMHVVLPKLVMSISLCRDVQVFTFSDKV